MTKQEALDYLRETRDELLGILQELEIVQATLEDVYNVFEGDGNE